MPKPGPKVKPKIYTVVIEPDLVMMVRKNHFYFHGYLCKDFKPREHLASDCTYVGLRQKILDVLNIGLSPRDRINNDQLLFKIY